ncbi:MAG: chromosome segregation protein SMC [Candidatus Wallbacteria bacterium HGW-Wallbacteria-1]|jgi:energy-coupling factor transporter ATP-binding protein EcfA2|uniref:Chromosome segregation protein SMC n=1 Tax=Candidatus Wallbacteria bacterium HGW-Wallbacteria-1 TaxID=2013854 RepID=A0A2N1PKY0_9BACT|nr:MAG: chromosome segregation protein SMC [Candidatus Wallbacteria bacterium HGW-Wallbacteria-1]
MIKREFSQFLQTLNKSDVSENVRKIANLVYDNLEILMPLSNARAQRIKKVVELAHTGWSTFSPVIKPLEQQNADQTWPFCRIKSLSVGPFRGFSKNEDFDLSSELVLIYGPNGTGKSSFCESLEFGLLGNVIDAENKRFRNQNDYLKNAHTHTFMRPVLVGIDEDGVDVEITPNEALYRFSFVEKNRIDSFARIAAQAPAKQAELISTLFGLDAFVEFVRNFTEQMDKRYIDLIGVKAEELTKKRLVLAGDQQQIDIIIPDLLRSIDAEEVELAQSYRIGISFAQMVIELSGDGDAPGLIEQYQEQLQNPLQVRSNLTRADLLDCTEKINKITLQCIKKHKELADLSQQVAFKQLYEAVTQVQASSPDTCPACKTPLGQVQTNPYIHASNELKKLLYLSSLQQEIRILNTKVDNLIGKIKDFVKICTDRITNNNPLLSLTSVSTLTDFWNSIQITVVNDLTLLEILEQQVATLENVDKEIEVIKLLRQTKEAELKRLRYYSEAILRLKTRRETAVTSLNTARNAIKQFETENDQLIKDVSAEKVVLDQNNAIALAYNDFVHKLNAYMNSLPAQLVENLGELVVTLFNAFNRNDGVYEQLADIRLPLSQNERLEISYVRSPETFFDVLHVLSEGHIRCIGLAILAAKNIKENCSILIFDDPVNAIDDEHRESIRRTLFEDDYFKGKQIILACHGEEFFKDVQNLLPVQRAKMVKTLSFLPNIGDFNINIDRNCSPRNYLIASRAHFDKNEIRDALAKSRRALELLAKGSIWKYVNRHGDGCLSIKMRSATAQIELRNLTEQLKSKIASKNFTDTNKEDVLTPIESLLGVSGDSREWRYLNKGKRPVVHP